MTMNKKTMISMGAALVFGLLAVFMVNRYISKKESEIYKGMELVPVVAITRDTRAGEKITTEIIAKRDVPQKFAPTNAVDPKDFELLIGQKLLYPMKRGDTVLWTSLSSDAEKLKAKGLAAAVTKGQRALSIAIDEVGGVGGLIKPNDHIDILCTVRSEATGQEATLTLLQNITVLATGRTMAGDAKPGREGGGGYGTLTLQVTLEEAELLVFAQKRTSLQTILRNPEDIDTREDIPKVGFSDILKDEYRRGLQERRNKIEIIKQGKTAKEK
jgi:pilus assembly protein CpaB